METLFSKQDLFISPSGDDAWSGRLAEPNADGTDGPLATLARARNLIRARKGLGADPHQQPVAGGLSQPFSVWLRGGRYPLAEPVLFGPQDSAPVTYRAYPGETPILDGTLAISGWQETTHKGQRAWVADLPDVRAGKWNFRELYVNGERRARPRLPKTGLDRMERVPGIDGPTGWSMQSYDQFVAPAGPGADVLAAQSPVALGEIEVVFVHFWIEERSPIAAYDAATRLATMARPSAAAPVGSFGTQLADYYLDNVGDALSEPGEWYLDRASARLTYLPLPGETLENTDVRAPRTLQLLVLQGQPDEQRYVDYLRFEGLTFFGTDWRHPEADGAEYVPLSGDDADYASRRHRRGKRAACAQAAADLPGVIQLEAARHCAIEDCTIENIGWYGLLIGDGCWGIRVVGNTIRNMGAGGVRINGAAYNDPPLRRTGNHRISDNVIHAGGRVFHSAVGVLAMHTCRTEISHNHIYDLFYSGVSCGWNWGYAPTNNYDNWIVKNHIHDIGQGLLSDMGGIYMLGVQPGCVLRGNLIHDINKAHYGAWCIYPDEGSAHLIIEDNVCYRTNDNVFHQHYGRENTVRNNIFAYGAEALIRLTRIDAWHRALNFYHNVLITDGEPVFNLPSIAARNVASDLNVLWDVRDRPLRFAEREETPQLDLAAWQAQGYDAHSLHADPRCADPLNADFALAPDSPAYAQGFHAIDLSDVGPREKGKRE